MIHSATGTLKLTNDGVWRAAIEVDPELVRMMRALVPRSVRLNVTRYAPHISVVREESIPHPEFWLPQECTFMYDDQIQCGSVYWWLNVWCVEAREFRTSLGLTPESEYTRPPDGNPSFHITIGNLKLDFLRFMPMG